MEPATLDRLHRPGVSRKVSADMFGLALRDYLRKLQRLEEGATERGHSLWEAVLHYLQTRSPAVVLRRFIATTRSWCAACCTIGATGR